MDVVRKKVFGGRTVPWAVRVHARVYTFNVHEHEKRTSLSPSMVRSTAAGRKGLMSEKRSSWACFYYDSINGWGK